MARGFAGAGGGTWVDVGQVPDTRTAFSVSCWFQLDSIAANNNRLISRWGNSNQRFLFTCNPLAINIISSGVGNPGVGATGATAGAVAPTTWVHGAALFDPSVRLAVYLNGAKDGENLTVPATMWFIVGGWPINLGADPDLHAFGINGRLAECAYWRAVLTEPEILALSKGVPANQIRPGSLDGYWPLYTNVATEPDVKMSDPASVSYYPGTVTGATAVANHAPVNRQAKLSS